jgi:hypothetical protein
MTDDQERTAVLDGLALIEARSRRDHEGMLVLLNASDDPDHLRTMAEVGAVVAAYAIGALVERDAPAAVLGYLVRLRGWGLGHEGQQEQP